MKMHMQRTRRRQVLAVMLVVAVLVGHSGLSPGVAGAFQLDPIDELEPINPVIDPELPNTTAPFTWIMAPRYAASWRAYESTPQPFDCDGGDRNCVATRYRNGYINPIGWNVTYNACESWLLDDREAVSFRWEIDGLNGIDFHHEEITSHCNFAGVDGGDPTCRSTSACPSPNPSDPVTPGDGGITPAGLPVPQATLLPPEPGPVAPDPGVIDPDPQPVAPDPQPTAPDPGIISPDLPDPGPETDGLPPLLPELGSYAVTLTVEFADESTASATHNIRLRDIVIVSIGDSNASGEGNPDREAEWGLQPDFTLYDDAEWRDKRCHRSMTSGPAFAAQVLEVADPHSSVTFVSFACSGAKTFAGLTGPYGGQDNPNDGTILAPQVDAAHAALCDYDPECPNPRPVDHLLISTAINDLGFSTIIQVCANLDGAQDLIPQATPFDGVPCSEILAGTVNARFSVMPDNLERLNQEIVEKLAPAHVHISEYPVDALNAVNLPFDGTLDFYGRNLPIFTAAADVPQAAIDRSSCGALHEITDGEAEWLLGVGARLNWHVRAAAIRHGWSYAGGIRDLFLGHGYCSGDNWHVHLGDSLTQQADGSFDAATVGILHPTAPGHMATASRLVASMADPVVPREARYQVTLDFDRIRVTDKRLADPARLINRNVPPALDLSTYERWLRVPSFGIQMELLHEQWVDFPDEVRYQAELAEGEELIVNAGVKLADEVITAAILPEPELPGGPGDELAPILTRSAGITAVALHGTNNNFGAGHPFCSTRTVKPGVEEITCLRQTENNDVRLEFDYRLTVWDMEAGPYDQVDHNGEEIYTQFFLIPPTPDDGDGSGEESSEPTETPPISLLALHEGYADLWLEETGNTLADSWLGEMMRLEQEAADATLPAEAPNDPEIPVEEETPPVEESPIDPEAPSGEDETPASPDAPAFNNQLFLPVTGAP